MATYSKYLLLSIVNEIVPELLGDGSTMSLPTALDRAAVRLFLENESTSNRAVVVRTAIQDLNRHGRFLYTDVSRPIKEGKLKGVVDPNREIPPPPDPPESFLMKEGSDKRMYRPERPKTRKHNW